MTNNPETTYSEGMRRLRKRVDRDRRRQDKVIRVLFLVTGVVIPLFTVILLVRLLF